MTALIKGACLLALMSAAAPAAAHADPDSGRLILEGRLRYEIVDQSGLPHQADALTLRTRLGFETPRVAHFKALVEGEAVTALVDRYNDTVHPTPGYPAIPDVPTAEINRAQVSWNGLPASEVTVGRQRIILGNARFVGNSGWRQNEQTFDAAVVASKALKPLTLTYAYIGRVNRVLGHDSPQGVWRGATHAILAEAPTALGRLSGYGYLLEFDNAPTQSSQTWGARLAGERKIATRAALTYELEYARQSDYRNNPASFGLDYVLASAGVKSPAGALSLVYERLGGDGAHGFQTPLATLHPFQGWSDVIGATPGAGLRDLYLRASYALKAGRTFSLKGEAHDFETVVGGARLGRELDLGVQTPLTPHLSLELAAADFATAGPTYPDARKLWITLEYRF